MKKKYNYETEALGVIHQNALAFFRVGSISADEMKEYDEGCLVAEKPSATYATTNSFYPQVAVTAKSAK